MGACCATSRHPNAGSTEPGDRNLGYNYQVHIQKSIVDRLDFIHVDAADEISLSVLLDQINSEYPLFDLRKGLIKGPDGSDLETIESLCGASNTPARCWQLFLNGQPKDYHLVADFQISYLTKISLSYLAPPKPAEEPL